MQLSYPLSPPSSFKGRCEKNGLVLFDVIPAKAGIQYFYKAPNTLDPGFHRGDEWSVIPSQRQGGTESSVRFRSFYVIYIICLVHLKRGEDNVIKEEKTLFLKEPERRLEQQIKDFINDNEKNRRTELGEGVYFEDPLIGFASGIDPLFQEYKNIIGSFHFTPQEIFKNALKDKGGDFPESKLEQISVISWILPLSDDTRRNNRKEEQFPSKLWAYSKDFGEACNSALRRHITSYLENSGYIAVAPLLSPGFRLFRDDRAGWTSNWSERHIAYACGLGTFSLSDGFISPKGIALRVGSVVTTLKLTPSERKYRTHRENCLFFRNQKCGKCIRRCPAGAITEEGHDKDRCWKYMNSESFKAKYIEYGLQSTPSACGLCQTGVPCEFEIPKVRSNL